MLKSITLQIGYVLNLKADGKGSLSFLFETKENKEPSALAFVRFL